ncbi:hypothetical protein LXL04_001713 [Taraxacum kok-saghyz]
MYQVTYEEYGVADFISGCFQISGAFVNGFWTCVDMASGRYLWRNLEHIDIVLEMGWFDCFHSGLGTKIKARSKADEAAEKIQFSLGEASRFLLAGFSVDRRVSWSCIALQSLLHYLKVEDLWFFYFNRFDSMCSAPISRSIDGASVDGDGERGNGTLCVLLQWNARFSLWQSHTSIYISESILLPQRIWWVDLFFMIHFERGQPTMSLPTVTQLGINICNNLFPISHHSLKNLKSRAEQMPKKLHEKLMKGNWSNESKDDGEDEGNRSSDIGGYKNNGGASNQWRLMMKKPSYRFQDEWKLSS